MQFSRFKEILFYALLFEFLSRNSAVYININYSFKLPKIFGIGNAQNSGCCPYIVYQKNDTRGHRVPNFIILGVQKSGNQIFSLIILL